ncbi:MAG: LysM peptidoglycan-binding domain-containing protein [Bacillota bacterium]|jgi:spore coat assembly protein SafA
MAREAMTEASVFTWSRERELSPVYERLLTHAPQSSCLELIQELCDVKRDVMTDNRELMAALGVDTSGPYADISIPDDFNETIVLLHTKENELLDSGYLRLDPHVEDPMARGIMMRLSRRKARQIALLREIAEKCRIVLIISPETTPTPPHHDHSTTPPHHFPPTHPDPVLDYVVQPGDTMFLIAQRHGVSLETLIRANPQIRNPDLIFPGDIIRIPRGDRVTPPSGHMPGGRRYIVVTGDTIIIIARRFGLSPAELVAFNPGLTIDSQLTPGQVIMIPASGAVG